MHATKKFSKRKTNLLCFVLFIIVEELLPLAEPLLPLLTSFLYLEVGQPIPLANHQLPSCIPTLVHTQNTRISCLKLLESN